MRTFFQQLAVYLFLVILLSLAAAFLPQIAPSGWATQAVGVLIWIAALVVGFRAISWGAVVYRTEIAPRTRSDLDSPFFVDTVRNLVLVLFLFIIGGGIATTLNEEFNASFFASGVGFAVSLGLAPVVGAYILDVRRAAIIDKAMNEGDFIQVGDMYGFVLGQDAYFLEILRLPDMRDVKIEHANVFGQFQLLERFEEIPYDEKALGAVIQGDSQSGFAYRYAAASGEQVKAPVPYKKGVAGQRITRFGRSLGYYRVIGNPLVTLELDADGGKSAENPQALLDEMLTWYEDFPDTVFDKTYQLKMHDTVYLEKSSVNGGAAVPARMVVRAKSYQLILEAERVGQTILGIKAYTGGWGYGTTSNLTIGNAADFPSR